MQHSKLSAQHEVELKVVSDPYMQGLTRPEALILLTCKRATDLDKSLQAKYHKTPHFRELSRQAQELYSTCALCGRADDKAALTVHHRRYTTLFAEDLTRDVVLVCKRDHARIHRKR
tara:strand:+ start:2474 stop:2824 length:351 start_codon:yes stop_codon:yes gene_type:complete